MTSKTASLPLGLRTNYALPILTPRLESIINSELLDSPTDTSVQNLEASKILSGEFSNREILLKNENEMGYKIYKLAELARDVTYLTPMVRYYCNGI
jgi:hypothetical protein